MDKTKNIVVKIIVGLISIYNRCISPYIPASCRHTPTCSEYTKTALKQHGLLLGCYLSIRRILRCMPLGTHGYDPVPRNKKRER